MTFGHPTVGQKPNGVGWEEPLTLLFDDENSQETLTPWQRRRNDRAFLDHGCRASESHSVESSQMQSRTTWAAFGVVAGVFLAAVAIFCFRTIIREPSAARTLDPAAVVHEIQGLSELVSVKYTVQKAVGFEEQKVPFGSEKLLLFVQAQVLAGIDLSSVAAGDVKLFSPKRMQVMLPPPKIIHIVIDDKETKVWDRRITWWTPWVPFNPDLERQARLAARDAIERAAIDMGILDQARRNAEAGIRSLLETLGIKSVTVVSAAGKT